MNEVKMKLVDEYFNYIKYGTKRIEIRLNDEKRKDLKKGDIIIFQNIENGDLIKTKVIDLFYEDNFNTLIDKHNIEALADKNITKNELLKILNEIYSMEEQNKYGVVGIKIELINE